MPADKQRLYISIHDHRTGEHRVEHYRTHKSYLRRMKELMKERTRSGARIVEQTGTRLDIYSRSASMPKDIFTGKHET